MHFSILFKFSETTPESFLSYFGDNILLVDKSHEFVIFDIHIESGYCRITFESSTIQSFDGLVNWVSDIDTYIDAVWARWADKGIMPRPTLLDLNMGTASCATTSCSKNLTTE